MTPRRAPAALVLAALLALTGCSGDTDLEGAAGPRSPEALPPLSSALPASPAPSAPEPSSVPPVPSTAPGAPLARGEAPASSAPAAAPASTTAAPAPVPARTAAAAPAAPPAATVPGRYAYDASGSFTATGTPPRSGSGTATLTVDRPAGGRQVLVLDGDSGRTETDVALRPDGRYLVRLSLTTPGFSEQFRPAEPVLLLPAPLVTGQRWEWTARSQDGSTTVTARNRVTGDRTQTVGGQTVATAVVETQLSIRGDVVYDGTTTTDYEPERGLPVRDVGSGRGTVNGVAFTTRTSTALRSLDPS